LLAAAVLGSGASGLLAAALFGSSAMKKSLLGI